jgi:3-carboxy-cis,cis-muconate cycloisomerase
LPSEPSNDLFTSLFVPDLLREAVSGRAWLQAMLDTERAYAAATARAGVIPADTAERIAAACDPDGFEVAQIAVEGRRVANPAEPLVRALRKTVGGEDAQYVHYGASSQDVVDTAAMLVARRSLDLILGDLDADAAACARLADAHRATIVPARTLLQQAVPTTFGLKAASWLVGVVEARQRLEAVRRERLAVQLGGAGGTLAALGTRGAEVMRLLAEELGLAEPTIPWHALRGRIAELGAALDLAAAACAKIARDVTLLAQTEVGEVSTGDDGRSSTMPHKRNPASALLAVACARHAHAQAGILTASVVQEHERGAGAWQAEWEALSGALAFAGGAAAGTRAMLEGLRVDEERMRRNLVEPALAERAAFLLAERLGLPEAQEAVSSGGSIREVLTQHLSPAEVESALDPAGYLGSADVFVDRALGLYRSELG